MNRTELRSLSSPWRERAHSDERASTLVELIVGMVVFAIIGGSVAGAMLQMLSTERGLRDGASFGVVGDAMATLVRADLAGSDGVLGDLNDATAAASVSANAWGCSAGSKPVSASVLLRVRQEGRMVNAQTAASKRLVHFVMEPNPAESGSLRVVRYVCAQGSAPDPTLTMVIAGRVFAGTNTAGLLTTTTSTNKVARATLRIETLGPNGTTNRASVTSSPRVFVGAGPTNGGGGNQDGEGQP